MNWFKRWLGRPSTSPKDNISIGPTPSFSDALAQSVSPLLEAGQLDDAEACIHAALAANPADGGALILQATVLRHRGQHAQALAVCEQAFACDCDPALIHLESAHCQRGLHDLNGAIDALHIAVALDPTLGDAWLLLGELLIKQERAAEGGDALVAGIPHLTEQRKPEGWFHLGQAMIETGRSGKACEALRECIRLDPTLAGAHIALGHALLMEEDEVGAIASYRHAASLLERPLYNLRLNLGIALMNHGDYDEARELLKTLRVEQPGDHIARWYMCQLDLLQCRWQEGWSNYPARFGAGSSPYRPMPFRPWTGERLQQAEPLLVLADQGLGDEIMFASCLPDVQSRADNCIVECEPRLLKLFSRSFPGIRFVATQRESTTEWLRGLPTPDRQIAAGDLPGLFRRSDSDFPERASYLRADPERVNHWKTTLDEALGPGLKVGISWRGGIKRTRTKARSLDADLLAPILNTPGVQFVNLQYGDYHDELAQLNARHDNAIRDFPEAIADYDETAALVGALDLVVTVCTAIVHLAGALGKPVWIMTPHAPGWRYTADRSTMPWYPSSRIFRQPAFNDWDPVCKEVSASLWQLTNNVTPSTHQV